MRGYARYAGFLKEQAAELDAECRALRFRPSLRGTHRRRPFGLPTLIDGPSEAARLDVVIEQVRNGIEQMASSQALQEVRRAIQEYRHVQKSRRKQRQLSRRIFASADDA